MSKGVTKDHVRRMLLEVKPEWEEHEHFFDAVIAIATFYLNREETSIDSHDFIDAVLMYYYVKPYQNIDIAFSKLDEPILEGIALEALGIHNRYKNVFNRLFTTLDENEILLTPIEQHALIYTIVRANEGSKHFRIPATESVEMIVHLAKYNSKELGKWLKKKERQLKDLKEIHRESVEQQLESKFWRRYDGQIPQELELLKTFKSGFSLYRVGQDEVSWVHAHVALRDGLAVEEIRTEFKDKNLFINNHFYILRNTKMKTFAMIRYNHSTQSLSVTNQFGEASLSRTTECASAVQETIELISEQYPVSAFYGWEERINKDQVLLSDGSITQIQNIAAQKPDSREDKKNILYGRVYLDSLTDEQLDTLDTSNLVIVVSSKVSQSQLNRLQKARRLEIQKNLQITEIPPHLQVAETLSIKSVKHLKAIPEGLSIGDSLTIEECHALQQLPSGVLPYSLDISFCDGLQLIPQMHIQGSLAIAMCDNVRLFSPGTQIDGLLDLHHLKSLKGLPNDMIVRKIVCSVFDKSSYENFNIFTLPQGVTLRINNTIVTVTAELFEECRKLKIDNLVGLGKYIKAIPQSEK